ncbi:acyltransferase [Escherichia coli]|nr:acyltransferase [Escherichia coli]EGK3604713.1 acyltransferase [Escherichia coli]
MDYRQEIDGLRALAVSAVLGYHFWPSVIKYGYLGVDVFFVISGFLITLYIYEENNKGTFSLKRFYERRIRRILPVTLLVLSVTLVLAGFILIGPDYDRFLQSVVAATTFTANIFFWRDGGYFGANDALKPLLHIWSLSVEEQFYLFFPLLLLGVFRYLKSIKLRVACIALLTLLSLLSYFYMIRIGRANPAFFLTPFRAWEFGAGCLSALFFATVKRQHSHVSLTVAMVLIVFGLTFSPGFFVPGFVSVFGTALFLSMSYSKNKIFDIYFSSSLVKKIGLTSFSIYLWHWPLVVFIGYISVEAPSNSVLLLFFLSTFALSNVSYKYVEQPFRHQISSKVTVSSSIAISVSIAVLAVALLKLEWFEIDLKDDQSSVIASSIQTNYRCNVSDYMSYGASRACLINKGALGDYSIALLGNSHAQMYAPAIEPELRKRNEKGLIVPLNGCLPTVDFNISADCARLAKLNLNAILSDKKISTVVIGMTWHSNSLVSVDGGFVDDKNKTKLFEAISALIDKLHSEGKKVFLVGPIMTPGYDLPSILSRKIKFDDLSSDIIQSLLEINRNAFDDDYNDLLIKLKYKLNDRLILPSNVFCGVDYCYFGDANGVFFSDSNHLSSYGVSKIKHLFEIINAG